MKNCRGEAHTGCRLWKQKAFNLSRTESKPITVQRGATSLLRKQREADRALSAKK